MSELTERLRAGVSGPHSRGATHTVSWDLSADDILEAADLLEEAERVAVGANKAVAAAYKQAHAEWQYRDKIEDECEERIRQWRLERDAFLEKLK